MVRWGAVCCGGAVCVCGNVAGRPWGGSGVLRGYIVWYGCVLSGLVWWCDVWRYVVGRCTRRQAWLFGGAVRRLVLRGAVWALWRGVMGRYAVVGGLWCRVAGRGVGGYFGAGYFARC